MSFFFLREEKALQARPAGVKKPAGISHSGPGQNN